MIEKDMYLINDRVWYSDINKKGELSVVALIDHFQNAAYANSADLGHDVAHLSQYKRAWLLASWNVYVKRYPKLDEKITHGTAASAFKGIIGYRDHCKWDESGDLIAWGEAQWFFYDGIAGKPIRPTPADSTELYNMHPHIEMQDEVRKIKIPEELEDKEAVVAGWRQIDTNDHVNNSQYVGIALDSLGEFVSPSHIRVEYIKAAVAGDIIIPRVGVREGRTVISLENPEGGTYAVVEVE